MFWGEVEGEGMIHYGGNMSITVKENGGMFGICKLLDYLSVMNSSTRGERGQLSQQESIRTVRVRVGKHA